MVIIAEANMLQVLEESDKKALSSLTGSDKIIVLSDKKSQVPVETMQLFMSIKAKTEFVQLEDIKSQFAMGFKYGEFSAKFAKDKVKILSNNDYSAVLPANMVCVKSLGTAKKTTTTASRSKAKVEKTVESKPVAKKAETGALTKLRKKADEIAEAKEAPKRRGKLKDLSAESLLAAYPALKPYETKIKSLDSMFATAIKNSTDADSSLKMQLKMTFADDSEAIWKIIKKDFAKLKALA